MIILFGSFFFEQHEVLDNTLYSFVRAARSASYSFEYRNEKQTLAANALTALSSEGAATGTLAAPGTAAAVPVLLYHGIVNKPDRFSLTVKQFKEQLFALKAAGYHTVHLQDVADFMAGKKVLDDKAFLLTFDDGRTDSYRGADPLLQSLGWSAVMFVATESSIDRAVRSKYYIDEKDTEKMIDSGRWEIGSHAMQYTGGYIPVDAAGTKGNFLSNSMWRTVEGRLETDAEYESRITIELEQSKQILEHTTGTIVNALAYPFGDYGQQTQNNSRAEDTIADIVKRTYDLAFKQVWSGDDDFSFNYPYDNSMYLRRVEVPTNWSGAELISFLETASPKQLPYDDTFDMETGWKHNWGRVVLQNGTLTLAAPETTTGALTFLDGTGGWSNYFFTVTGAWRDGSTISLLGRYRNGENYTACTFTNENVFINETKNGAQKNLAAAKHSVEMPVDTVSLGMLVDGNAVKCYIGSRLIAYVYTVDQELSSGGIGLKIWDQTPGKSFLVLDALHAVSPEAMQVLLQALPRYVTR